MSWLDKYTHGGNQVQITGKLVVGVIGFIFLLIFLFTLFYQVGTDEVGVITRFGKYIGVSQPGLHAKLPYGIDRVTKVPVMRVQKEEFGFRTLRPGVKTEYLRAKATNESLMLTGDLNSAVVEWVVQYRIKDPANYLFKVRNVRGTIRDAAESVMRTVVGDRSVDEVIILSRREVAMEAKKTLQKILDNYETGIHVVTLELKDVNPPDPVKPAFNEVNEAKQEKERMVNEAWEAYNKVIPKAKGEAEKTIRQAEGYALNRVNRAKGDAEKFTAIWKEYSRAKDVTRRRLYLETMNEILPKVGMKYILEDGNDNLLKLIDLNKNIIRGKK